jgi:hypothetical protein
MEPNPANGTPIINQIIESATTRTKKNVLKKKPKIDIHISGLELYANKLRSEFIITNNNENFKNFDSPANLGGLGIFTVVELNPTQALSPRKKL